MSCRMNNAPAAHNGIKRHLKKVAEVTRTFDGLSCHWSCCCRAAVVTSRTVITAAVLTRAAAAVYTDHAIVSKRAASPRDRIPHQKSFLGDFVAIVPSSLHIGRKIATPDTSCCTCDWIDVYVRSSSYFPQGQYIHAQSLKTVRGKVHEEAQGQ